MFSKMTQEQVADGVKKGYSECIVEAKTAGTLCWDISDTREREPIYNVEVGDRFWCCDFKETENGYVHSYGNMAPTDVLIETDVVLELVYITDDSEEAVLHQTTMHKSANYT